MSARPLRLDHEDDRPPRSARRCRGRTTTLGTISTVLSVAATACACESTAAGRSPRCWLPAPRSREPSDTYKSCASGAALDCATGIAGMIPGGRILGAVGKGATCQEGLDAAEEAGDATRAIKKVRVPSGALSSSGRTASIPRRRCVMAPALRRRSAPSRLRDEVLATDPYTGQTVWTDWSSRLHVNDDTGPDRRHSSSSTGPRLSPGIERPRRSRRLLTTRSGTSPIASGVNAGDLRPGGDQLPGLRRRHGGPSVAWLLAKIISAPSGCMHDLKAVDDVHT